jgi:hypothetical protein
MAETDVPKRVVIVLLVLTILISFMGTLTFLQYYMSSPPQGPASDDEATIGLNVLTPFRAQNVPVLPSSADDSSVSVTINQYAG